MGGVEAWGGVIHFDAGNFESRMSNKLRVCHSAWVIHAYEHGMLMILHECHGWVIAGRGVVGLEGGSGGVVTLCELKL